jgi:hypothetical protein
MLRDNPKCYMKDIRQSGSVLSDKRECYMKDITRNMINTIMGKNNPFTE